MEVLRGIGLYFKQPLTPKGNYDPLEFVRNLDTARLAPSPSGKGWVRVPYTNFAPRISVPLVSTIIFSSVAVETDIPT